MFRLRFIERPTTETILPQAAAASMTCWIRWMCDANDVTITRPCAWRTMSRSAAPTVRSEGVRPGRSALVESASSRATPASPSSRSAIEVGGPSVDRRVVELEVAGVHDGAVLGVQDDRDGVWHRVRDPDELRVERADARAARLRLDLDELGVDEQAVLVELGLHEPEREARSPHLGLCPDLAEEVRQRPDVILVAVREDDRVEDVGVLCDVREVGEDEVDSEQLRPRKREAGVDQDHAPAVLEGGHVLAHLAQPAQRDDPDRLGHA